MGFSVVRGACLLSSVTPLFHTRKKASLILPPSSFHPGITSWFNRADFRNLKGLNLRGKGVWGVTPGFMGARLNLHSFSVNSVFLSLI